MEILLCIVALLLGASQGSFAPGELKKSQSDPDRILVDPAAPVDVLASAEQLATSKDFKFRVYPGTKWYLAQPKDKRPPTLDCTQFLSAVAEQVFSKAKKEYTDDIKKKLMLSNFSDEERKPAALNKLVDDGDKRTRGVQYALTDSGVGVEVKNIESAKPGDLVQYWYKIGANWSGHSGVIVSVTGTKAVVLSSHKTSLASEKDVAEADRKGGVGQSIPIDLGASSGKKVYLVRVIAPKG